MPSTATTREGVIRGGIAPSGLHAGSPAHAAHTLPRVGTVSLMGIARSRCGHPRIRDAREYRRLFDSLDLRAWD